MNYTIVKYWRKTRDFLDSSRSREFLVFLFFLAISATFWCLQALNESTEVDVYAPLRLVNVPQNVTITTELPDHISARLTDRGTNLIRFVGHRQLDTIRVDFANYDNGLISSRIQLSASDIQQTILSHTLPSTHIIALRPDTLEFYYSRGQRHKLPVQVSGSITTSPQNYITQISTYPDSVWVYASSNVLDTMKAAYTQAVSLTDLTDNATQRIRLQSHRGVKYEPSQVSVQVNVDYYTEKSIQVPIIGLNFPADKQLVTFPAIATITFRVGAAQYNQISAESFVLAPTYEELLENEPVKYRLHLRSIPDGVSNVRITPSEVDYLIEQYDGKEEEE